MLICSISNEPAKEPVVSPRSGCIFEKRLIEAHLQSNASDPINNEPLQIEELIPINTAAAALVTPPKPASASTVPSLLSSLQTEWDALALETFSLRKQLHLAKQDLSTALYQYEAAVRVAARLRAERDEARATLAQLSASLGTTGGSGATGGSESATVESIEEDVVAQLPEEIVAQITNKNAEIFAERKSRKIPQTWLKIDDLSQFSAKTVQKSKNKSIGSQKVSHSCVFFAPDDSHVFFSTGPSLFCYAKEENKISTLKAPKNSNITAICRHPSEPENILIGTSAGDVFAAGFKKKDSLSLEFHSVDIKSVNQPIVALFPHPCGDAFLIVVTSTKYAFFSLGTSEQPLAVVPAPQDTPEYTCGLAHPDGALLALGTSAGSVVVYDVRQSAVAATFAAETSEGIAKLAFAENGYWLLSLDCAGAVSVWDLRKVKCVKRFAGPFLDFSIDYTSQYIALVSESRVDIAGYVKSGKKWVEYAAEVELEGQAEFCNWKGRDSEVSVETLAVDSGTVVYTASGAGDAEKTD